MGYVMLGLFGGDKVVSGDVVSPTHGLVMHFVGL
tara:strand:- start:677 stop:778 length:102 start_codon:yes stop_codon:yes gene_type:complete